MSKRDLLLPLAAVLASAAILRAALLTAGAFTFNADEAVVAVMARHIWHGKEIPVFFYGQAYMGSLDAILVALGFAVFGESVLAMRIVQSILYMAVIATTYWLGWRLSGRRYIASVAALIAATPPAVMTLYTTATLGGYNETLILGNLILIYGYEVTHEHESSWRRWAVLGAAAGLGWWTNGLIVVYLAPVALLILRRFSSANLTRYLWAFLFVMLFSAPWWQYNFSHNNAAIAVFLHGRRADNTGFEAAPVGTRLVGLLFLGLPAAMGIRFPWAESYFAFPLSALALPGCAGLFAYWVVRRKPALRRDARGLLLLMVGLFLLIFVASTFGTDPTGRYFLPLIPPLAILTGATLYELRPRRRRLVQSAGVGLLAFYLISNGAAALRQPPGFTTQFDPITHIPHDHDQALIDFLEDNGFTRGYSNYWVAFRLAFLTGERIVLSATLPYKADLSYNPADERYPPYRTVVQNAGPEQIVYITSNHPRLDEIIRQRMAEAGVGAEETQIGPYHVFFNLSKPITPEALGLDRLNAGHIEAYKPQPRPRPG
ncbi:MAG: glycosyltransferase family 39 protein [Anaerolineae bacterium]|nr:glycosyltransferase family 39 protein [Anaerolineae bacterium]